MAPKTIYPRSSAEIVALLNVLGFKKKIGIGRGKHPQKYIHPARRNLVEGDQPFILVTHDYFDEKAMRLMKKLQNWGFSREEVELACQGIPPEKQQPDQEIDTEPESA